MRTGILAAFLCLLLAALAVTTPARAATTDNPTLLERPTWKRHFDEAGVAGTMVLRRDGSSEVLVHDATRAATRYLPASTFKVLNTCIALETKAVSGPDELFPYDGTPRAFPAWNTDLTLTQAFRVSCVPVFQEIARRIGQDRMARFVTAARYGNADISGGIDRFWLEGGLRISALEQIDFLARLTHDQLPFSPATLAAVRAIMVVETTPDHIIRAKTGWATSVTPNIGWYVGTVTRGRDTWYFALNSDITDPAKLKARQALVKAILHDEGIL